jgi:hypothetical protein
MSQRQRQRVLTNKKVHDIILVMYHTQENVKVSFAETIQKMQTAFTKLYVLTTDHEFKFGYHWFTVYLFDRPIELLHQIIDINNTI